MFELWPHNIHHCRRFNLPPVENDFILHLCDACRHIQSIAASTTLKLTVQDVAEIDTILVRAKGPSGSVYELEREFKGPHGRIMKYNLNQINQGAHLEELCHR